MKIFNIECGGKIHKIGIDEHGCIQMLHHDYEEEEVFRAMGLEVSKCFDMVDRLQSSPNMTLLQGACWQDLQLVEMALLAGADPDTKEYKTSPLWFAQSNGSVPLVKLLVDAGVNLADQSEDMKRWIGSIAEHLPAGLVL